MNSTQKCERDEDPQWRAYFANRVDVRTLRCLFQSRRYPSWWTLPRQSLWIWTRLSAATSWVNRVRGCFQALPSTWKWLQSSSVLSGTCWLNHVKPPHSTSKLAWTLIGWPFGLDSAKTSLRPMIKKRSPAGYRCFFFPSPRFSLKTMSCLSVSYNLCKSLHIMKNIIQKTRPPFFAYFMFSRILQCGILENLATLRHTPRGPRNHEFQGLMKEKCCKWWAMRSP